MRHCLAFTATAASAPLSFGCAPPFRVAELRARGRARTQIVFITGVYDDEEDVRQHAVREVVEAAVGPVDMVVVSHETPSFIADKFTNELQRRVILDPRAARYDRRVVLGFSSGGTAALTYISRQPQVFDAAVLYAPYLGPQFIIDEIVEAGGLPGWKPTGPIESQELLWVWLRDYRVGQPGKPSLWLLWSAEDEAAPGLPLLREHLPAERVVVGHGKHGWEAFDAMWPAFVRDHPRIFRDG